MVAPLATSHLPLLPPLPASLPVTSATLDSYPVPAPVSYSSYSAANSHYQPLPSYSSVSRYLQPDRDGSPTCSRDAAVISRPDATAIYMGAPPSPMGNGVMAGSSLHTATAALDALNDIQEVVACDLGLGERVAPASGSEQYYQY